MVLTAFNYGLWAPEVNETIIGVKEKRANSASCSSEPLGQINTDLQSTNCMIRAVSWEYVQWCTIRQNISSFNNESMFFTPLPLMVKSHTFQIS